MKEKSAVTIYKNQWHEECKRKCRGNNMPLSDLVAFLEKKLVEDKEFFTTTKKEYFEWLAE